MFRQTRGGVRVEPAASKADLPKAVKLFKAGTRSERFALVGVVSDAKDVEQAAAALAIAAKKNAAAAATKKAPAAKKPAARKPAARKPRAAAKA